MISASCGIVVPVYRALTPVEKVVLQHNARVLRKYPFVIIGPSSAVSEKEEARKIVLHEDADVTIHSFPDEYFDGISGYNKLLKSHLFFDAFSDKDFILICQGDAVVLSGEIKTWLQAGYDFIGAPHFQGYGVPELPPRFIPGANGGLSLRNVAASKSVLDQIRVVNKNACSKLIARSGLPQQSSLYLRSKPWLLSERGVNEDIFWTVEVPNVVSNFRVAPPEKAACFAYEILPRYLFEMTGGKLPFGCHAWQRYDQDFWLNIFPPKLAADIRAVLS